MLRFIGIIFSILFCVSLALGGSMFWDAFIIEPDKDAEDIQFTIQQGASVDMISSDLEEAGVISSAFLFKTYVWFLKSGGSLQAGEFTLQKNTNYQTLVSKLLHAKSKDVSITIPEGHTIAQIGLLVTEKFDHIKESDWSFITGDKGKSTVTEGNLLSSIPAGQTLEGYLFPDTYRFREDASASVIVNTMIKNLKSRFAENNIVIPDDLIMENKMSLHDLIILASIVEREVRDAEDMKVVAGIFLTRLKIGMALQADSTVNYVTGKKDAAILLVDSKIDSPYNTYKNLGLPIGPISNPGMNAINAVLNSIDSDYLYFLTTKEGEVIYSKTFNEHIDNKYKYLK